jgi:hypothetical protein
VHAGRGFGAVLLVETKSGTNQMHGRSLFAELRVERALFLRQCLGSHLDASGKPVPNMAKGVSQGHRTGGTIEGFYFGSLERY